jgi:hypothetical protein
MEAILSFLIFALKVLGGKLKISDAPQLPTIFPYNTFKYSSYMISFKCFKGTDLRY